MSYRHDDLEDDQPHRSGYQAPDRELTLGTGTILGIFFGLVLLCAVFFGFGYSMGNKSRPVTIPEAAAIPPSTTDFSTFKPSSGVPASAAAPSPATSKAPVEAAVNTHAPTVRTSSPAPLAPLAPKPNASVEAPAAAVPRAVPATESGLTFIVQVAAVSHPEDAELLAAALRRKGYAVNARSEAQDKLIHIQVGPFATKKEADAISQRLLTDGYKAIVK